MAALWLIRYDELFLKSPQVMASWEHALLSAIRDAMPDVHVSRERGRIWVEGRVDPEKLRRIFGIVSFSPCRPCRIPELESSLVGFCTERRFENVKTFALRVRRIGDHPFSSMEKARELGQLLQDRFPGLAVNLDTPEREVFIEIRGDRCVIFDEVIRGPGGLPPGVEGTVVALLSGGIDSPVAAYHMMKRGCRVLPVYVDMPPFLDEGARSRVEMVTDALRMYQPSMALIVVRDTYVHTCREILAVMQKERYVCLFCKRRMYRIAEKIAREQGALGIVTGESLGQVASQTLDNLLVLSDCVEIPVYRPLISFDKSEIVDLARKIGTFGPSTLPLTSCCCAVPKRPATRADPKEIRALEEVVEGQIGAPLSTLKESLYVFRGRSEYKVGKPG